MRNQYKILAEKYQLITENDKEDIMAALDTIGKEEQEMQAPRESIPHIIVTMEHDGVFDSITPVINGKLPSTARKAIKGVYIDTAPAVKPDWPVGTNEYGSYTLYITKPEYIKMWDRIRQELKQAQGKDSYGAPDIGAFMNALYTALQIDGGMNPVLPLI